VLVNKIPYYFHDPRRGDIIVFENPNPQAVPDRGVVSGFFHWLFQGLGFQQPENEDFIKRVIGLPGDVVEGKHGSVFINGERLREPYLTQTTQPFDATTVPEGKLFVMGDNRGNSLDSRFTLGFVPIDKVIGEAFIKLWPPSRFGLLH
jgi:signal peptidase I